MGGQQIWLSLRGKITWGNWSGLGVLLFLIILQPSRTPVHSPLNMRKYGVTWTEEWLQVGMKDRVDSVHASFHMQGFSSLLLLFCFVFPILSFFGQFFCKKKLLSNIKWQLQGSSYFIFALAIIDASLMILKQRLIPFSNGGVNFACLLSNCSAETSSYFASYRPPTPNKSPSTCLNYLIEFVIRSIFKEWANFYDGAL